MAANKSRVPQDTITRSPRPSLKSTFAKKHLDTLRPVLTNAATGNFSTPFTLPPEGDDDMNMYAGVKAMQEVIAKQAEELAILQNQLHAKTSDHSRALEEAQALTHLGSWEWDIATNVISWSDELYRIYGMRPQERAIGFEEFIELIHPEDRSDVQQAITAAFNKGESFEFEHRIILPSGAERNLKGMGKVILDDSKAPIRMHGTSQDITIAKQLDNAKDEFLSLVSHQLRTPLTIIRIHGNILEDGIAGPLDPVQEKHIRTMTSASIRLISLVDDILSISRLTLNRIRINAQPSDPNKLIGSCIDEVLPFIKLKEARISFTADRNLGLVPIDTVVFGEIVRNLLNNAARYVNAAHGKIDVTFTVSDDEYLLTVRDNGIGIPKADQASIFQRFFRAPNAKVADSEGSGLGLYIVKQFTEAAGGRIWFDSTEHKGTTFFVAFPPYGMRSRHTKTTL